MPTTSPRPRTAPGPAETHASFVGPRVRPSCRRTVAVDARGPEPVTIRAFVPGDEPRLADLWNRAYGGYAGHVPRTVAYWRWCILGRPGLVADDVLVATLAGDAAAGYGVLGRPAPSSSSPSIRAPLPRGGRGGRPAHARARERCRGAAGSRSASRCRGPTTRCSRSSAGRDTERAGAHLHRHPRRRRRVRRVGRPSPRRPHPRGLDAHLPTDRGARRRSRLPAASSRRCGSGP
jgi:hypothetical protein